MPQPGHVLREYILHKRSYERYDTRSAAPNSTPTCSPDSCFVRVSSRGNGPANQPMGRARSMYVPIPHSLHGNNKRLCDVCVCKRLRERAKNSRGEKEFEQF